MVPVSMRCWLAAVVVAAAVGAVRAGGLISEDMAELAAMVRENCAAETGADVALIERVNAGAPLMEDAALKCYMKCTMETAGMFSEGRVDEDALLSMLPEAAAAAIEPHIRACGTRTGPDDCQTAFNTQQCWQNAAPDIFELI